MVESLFLCVQDALQAASYGVSAVIVSNHGGRQLDSAPVLHCSLGILTFQASIDCLPSIARSLKQKFPACQVVMIHFRAS